MGVTNNLHQKNESLKKQIKNASVYFLNLFQIFLPLLAGKKKKKKNSAQTYPSIETPNSINIYKQTYTVTVEQKQQWKPQGAERFPMEEILCKVFVSRADFTS